MPIYLYVKTHNKTGLKYLGKTAQIDPFKYKGSGKYWRLHLKKHGNDVSTEILLESDSKTEIKRMGLYYSVLWNVVDSIEWANLKPETGDGGGLGPQNSPAFVEAMKARKGISSWNKGLTKHTNPSVAQISTKNKGKPAHNKGKPGKSRIPDTDERQRRVATRKAKNSYGQSKGLKWFNNGVEEKMLSAAPDQTWSRGRIPKMVECLREIASAGGVYTEFTYSPAS